MSYPLPENEDERLETLRRLHIYGTGSEKKFDQVADAARTALGTEYAAVNLIFDDSQWSKAACGIALDEAPREHSICSRAVAHGEMLVVEDLKADERFADNPFVTDSPNLRFYAGAPLNVEGVDLGTLCVFDDQSRSFTETDRKLLAELATVTSELLEARLETYRAQYLNAALEQVTDPVSIIEGNPDSHGEMKTAWVNMAYAMSAPEGYGSPVGMMPWIFEDMGEDLSAKVQEALSEGHPLRGETDGTRPAPGESQDESPYSVAWLLAPIRSDEGQITHWMTVHRDITERKARERELEREAAHDPLTGLLNRSAIESRIQKATSAGDCAGALLYMDLDGFKKVNDSYGHSTGDHLLKQTASIFKDTTRQQDAVGRVGGDEFVVWISPPTGKKTAERVARRIAEACAKPFEVDGNELSIGVSVGVVRSVADYEEAGAALEAADAAMYEAKRSDTQVALA